MIGSLVPILGDQVGDFQPRDELRLAANLLRRLQIVLAVEAAPLHAEDRQDGLQEMPSGPQAQPYAF